jgi:parvulin-like peptidyl-prolyl isomerase
MQPPISIKESGLTTLDLLPLLTHYQLLPQLLKELIIDQAIHTLSLSPEEEVLALEQFYTQQQIQDEPQRQVWLNYYRMTPEQLRLQAHRQFKLQKFKQLTWGSHLESDFLKHKSQFDQYIYSLIRVDSLEVAQELYFRLQGQEQTFPDLARQYSQGPETQTGGLVGPITAGKLHPTLVQLLTNALPGQVRPPAWVDKWFVILRLEQQIPAQLDRALREQLLEHHFQSWLKVQLQTIPHPLPASTTP